MSSITIGNVFAGMWSTTWKVLVGTVAVIGVVAVVAHFAAPSAAAAQLSVANSAPAVSNAAQVPSSEFMRGVEFGMRHCRAE